jgi:hypothetical protein
MALIVPGGLYRGPRLEQRTIAVPTVFRFRDDIVVYRRSDQSRAFREPRRVSLAVSLASAIFGDVAHCSEWRVTQT